MRFVVSEGQQIIQVPVSPMDMKYMVLLCPGWESFTSSLATGVHTYSIDTTV